MSSAAAIIKLQRAGFSEEQVDALAALIDEQLATKSDLERLRADLAADSGMVRSDLRLVEKTLRAEIELTKRDLTIRIGGMLALGIGILAAIVTFLSRLPGHT